jgi:hypothetical protein
MSVVDREADENSLFSGEMPSPIMIETQRRPGPRDIPYGIPEDQWSTVLAQVENHVSYRKIAAEYGVSHETIRRLVQASRKASSFERVPTSWDRNH